ncbi:hypothetical protein FRC0154_00519 [Corynebacterium diphtheriae]|nr:hypothetical protein FRC0101_00512 [Corynebacterium diphtheriae]CAB0737994.1 hypothetical protein FRC0114_00505 [Corynebacterium diphtheriae]CAB0739026.1 hypothetical protein FRC0150_00552 [Corynebacterium diphtheriae]CAB0877114.1 hypothetical protein FRC0402_00393 [Corynebacterium diphtheriae]CAB1031674.1 hypothetical protein FRC0154_00519 [Corynebacterium diphtheriae]
MYILASAKVGRLIPGSGGLALGMLIGSLIPLPLGAVNLPLFFTSSHLIALAIGTAILASLIPYSFEMAALRRLPLRHIRNPLLPRTRLRRLLRLATTPPTHQYHQRDRHGARHHRQRGNHN